MSNDNKGKQRETFLRRFQILELLYTSKRKKSATEIHESLETKGIKIERRQIQKDLDEFLSVVFPLVRDDNSPPGWTLNGSGLHSNLLSLKDADTALALVLVEKYLENLIPCLSLKKLKTMFQEAYRILAEQGKRTPTDWLKRTLWVSRGVNPKPPIVPPSVRKKITDAFPKRETLIIHYQRPQAVEVSVSEVHPQGLLLKGEVLYLVAVTNKKYPDSPVQYAMHRIKTAENMGRAAVQTRKFDLRSRNANGDFGFPVGEIPINIRLHVQRDAVNSFLEMNYSEKQIVYDNHLKKQVFQVDLEMPDNKELRGWILSFGDLVEVKSPVSLRREIKETVLKSARRYAR
jgi:predicted DNA-binding transcriptional regulator YafY